MKWKPHKYYITSGEWTISKCYIKKQALYVLWRKKKLIDVFDSSEEAKKEVGK